MDKRFIEVDCVTFAQAVKDAKASLHPKLSWRIDCREVEDYQRAGAKCYVTELGSTIAIAKDGEILSLCVHDDEPEWFHGVDLVDFAKELGGQKAIAYEGFEQLYTECGFDVVIRIPLEKNHMPSDWKPEYGKEDALIFELADDFDGMDMGRELIQKIKRSDSDEQCIACVYEFLKECEHIDDAEQLRLCLIKLERVLNSKEISLESIRLPDELEIKIDQRDELNFDYVERT